MMMSVSKLEIDTVLLQDGIERLRDSLAELRAAGSEMMGDIKRLNSMWEGEAKEAFARQFQRDYAELCYMEEVTETLINDLEQAKSQYVRCEGNVSSIVGAIRI